MIRALAIRTMGCIRIERILDYLIEPIRRGVKDTSPYVRKTTALCIAKVFDLSFEVADDCGFLEILQDLLMNDTNPMVVSNVIAALADIQSLSPTIDALQLNEAIVKRLLSILNDCTEWGQVFILDAIAAYSTGIMEEAEKIVESVLPRLQHANQAIVMSAVNLLLQHGLVSETLPENHHLRTVLERKLSAPLISMLSAPPNPPEIQYAALRNVIIILRKFPKLFGNGIKVFFCNYNDPQYIKLEKLEALGLVVDDQNIDRILPELLEYAKDVDSRFARKTIQILAQCALNAPRWSSRIGEVFSELLQIDRSEIAQQITISLVSLLRDEDCSSSFLILLKSCYFADLQNANQVIQSDAEALAAFAWIFGAFLNESSLGLEPDEIDAGLLVFSQFLERFALEPLVLQEQIVLASLKMYLLNRHSGQAFRFKDQATEVLMIGAKNGEAIDFQDRCRMYAILLQNEPLKAQTESTTIDPFSTFASEDADKFAAQATNQTPLEALLLNDFQSKSGEVSDETGPLESFPYQLGSIASVLHLAPIEFVSARQIVDSFEASASMASLPEALVRLMRSERPALTNLLDLQVTSPKPAPITEKPAGISEKYANLLDLLD